MYMPQNVKIRKIKCTNRQDSLTCISLVNLHFYLLNSQTRPRTHTIIFTLYSEVIYYILKSFGTINISQFIEISLTCDLNLSIANHSPNVLLH